MITRATMQGVSLIEVLVTTVVLAFGLLGTSALHITGLKGSDAAHYRTQATFLANDLAERMRFNPGGVRDGAYQYESTATNTCNVIPENYKNCSNTDCGSSDLAIYDLYQIKCGFTEITDGDNPANSGGVVNLLPEGKLAVGCGALTCTENVDHSITVSWKSRADDGEGADQLTDESVGLSFIP